MNIAYIKIKKLKEFYKPYCIIYNFIQAKNAN